VILVVTNRADYTADWLILELERRRVQFVRFNTEDYPARAHVVWRTAGPAKLRLASGVLNLSDVTSVWYRRPLPPDLSRVYANEAALWASGESRATLTGVWRTLPARWVNHPDRNRAASSKLEQLQRAHRLGLHVPESLVTNDPEEAIPFANRVGRVVCKPLRGGRLYIAQAEQHYFTSRLDPDTVAALKEIGPEPIYLQAFIDKSYDVRVTVIGREAFGVRIESQIDEEATVDWRRGNVARMPHIVEPLPDDVSKACVTLVAQYDLNFGAIDLVREPGGRYVFLELNPNGQWAWLQQITGLPLRERLVELLVRKE
jgi:glutathione synthase/RimK-type ligase-like ATP-grasp enzyme